MLISNLNKYTDYVFAPFILYVCDLSVHQAVLLQSQLSNILGSR